MEISRLELKKQLTELDHKIQYHDSDDLEGEELTINAMKIIVLMEEALTDMLSNFVKAYILNDISGFVGADGVYHLHKFRHEVMKRIVAADTFLDLPDHMKSLIKHEAVKSASLLLGNTLE